ncbi:xanthine dehydrogenase family protein molybdopterin-binding subunit [Pelagibacterium sp. H642]|uniref:xanthine dehydrogenase family protein molybdopterin-binding subunit n=1 Tax=Pelagibacterium sp. H642 TaxID=1881069 RepID=UPI0028157FBF|nr:xanthine dehydrogenase family protein molybdopterin-binding subunit [Pelagibacterium sp. H642]WMT91938.1 xanthine dehydrogenase family protein molybdopterin-binding subunit [Pelagibacterium sp. H642]
MSNLGYSIPRVDGHSKVTGGARFTGDHNLPGQLHAMFVSASIPAGRVLSIEVDSALALPGVVRVLLGRDMPRPSPAFEEVTVPPLATKFIPLQSDEIVHEGQPVAMVLAETLEAATAGAAVVSVQYERGEFVNPETSVLEVAPERGGYLYLDQTEFVKGDIEAGFALASAATNAVYSQSSRHANPMEPSAVLASWSGDHLTIYDSTQHLGAVQRTLASVFGISENQVRVLSQHTGGGFGVKGYVWPHEVLAAQAAYVVRRPVKLVLTRQQMYGMVGMQPQINQRMRLGATGEGRLVGIDHVVSNVTGVTEDYVEFGTSASRSFYACDNIFNRQVVRRGNMTLPTYQRAPAEGPGSWALGAAMDELATALGIDPLDLRLASYAEVDPVSGNPWSSKKLREAYQIGDERFGWRSRPPGGQRDGNWLVGYGMADASQGVTRFGSTARVRLRSDGTAVLESSFTDVGQGPATVFSQVVAEILGLDPNRVVSRSGDTDLPYAGPTYGAATTISTGTALHKAANVVRERLARLAGLAAHEVTMRDGMIVHGERSRTIEEVMAEAGVSELAGDGALDIPNYADSGLPGFPARSFGAVFVEVGVDPQLGLMRLRRATGVYSAGRILNMRTAQSQMIGGIVWGWGMAAMERSQFDPIYGRWHSKDLAGVPIPVNADIPPAIDVSFVDEFDDNAGPLGVRGIGTLAACGVAAAIANAVFDAIGVRVRHLPITADKILNDL